ncbi:Transcription initiation factor TFIID subunit 12 [Tolypocladium paradoxum]|uniref:Transcription initiation factor TFIID subunit 12 n=1 Tax=Tolypocladium paradoxum TaxID=94208 RepID=A0A2S4LBA8_9HYPO|nr:Transcription initiation factor TFIID subunit 12 [Tolypocladium paradoxum]
MNPAQGQMPQQGQAQGQQGPAGQQPRGPPMYQPHQIRGLPMLSEEEKTRYEAGLRGLWDKLSNSPTNSPDQLAARKKISDFSRMLITKIQQRRSQQSQQQAQHQGQQQGGQAPVRPLSAQQNPAGQVAAQAQAQGQAQQQLKQQQVAPGNGNAAQGGSDTAGTAAGQPPNPQAPSNTVAAPAPTPAQRPRIPDNILQHTSKMIFRPPAQLADKSPAEVNKWVSEMKERYARALFTMENSNTKVASMEKIFKERAVAGKPLKDEELRQYQARREQQLKFYAEAHKWVEGVRKQQEILQGNTQQANQDGGAAGPAAAPAGQQTDAAQALNNANAAQNRTQAANQGAAAAPVNAALEAAKNQQQMAAANRASPANGTPTPTPSQAQAQAQSRPVPNAAQAVQQQPQGQPQAQQTHPAPVNTALATSMAQAQVQAQAHAQASAPPAQGAARVQTPQSSTPVTAAGPTRALSHSAAMSLANQRAASTPGSAPGAGQQPAVGTPSSTAGAMNPGAMQPQGHPHAHPTQQQTGMTAKMPIPKQLPEKATAVPQGVTMGGGVSAGRPTMSQGTGTLGGVMNQPPVARVPAYNHDAEGDHILSKKKLDELVRQVCGGSAEGQDGNQLSPEVEENILNMADLFVDNVLHAACRNSKERGSKVLEIRDIQLILERTYNIRVPGYSSDELRTVRKVQPSPGWIAKMSAVQAAKVMPGKGDL